MMRHDGELKLPKECPVLLPKISHVTGEYLAKNGVSTVACPEFLMIEHDLLLVLFADRVCEHNAV